MAKSKAAPMPNTERTSAGLCEALFQEFDLLRQGKSDVHRASAVSKLAIQIINTKRLEMEAAVLLVGGSGQLTPVLFETPSVRLGTAA